MKRLVPSVTILHYVLFFVIFSSTWEGNVLCLYVLKDFYYILESEASSDGI